MKFLYILCLFLVMHLSSYAQQQVLEVAAPSGTGGNYGSARFYDPSTLGRKNEIVLNYADIAGSPFWDDHWNAAYLFLSSGGIVKTEKVKLNLYTNDIHYMKDDIEQVAQNNIVKIVLFKGQDTTKILSVFELNPDFTDKSNPSMCYFRVLNNGKVRLLELKKALIRTGDYDPLSGKRSSGFFTKSFYSISADGIFLPLKTLNEENILSAVYPDTNSEEWLKQKKNKLRNESEVLSFFNYYNSNHK